MAYGDIDMNIKRESSAMLKEVRRFAIEVMRPAGLALDRLHDPEEVVTKDSLLWDVTRKFRELDLHLLFMPKSVGGLAEDIEPLAAILIAEQLGYGDAGLAIGLLVSSLPFLYASYFPEPELQQLAPEFCADRRGRLIGCWAITEPDHGSDWILGGRDPGCRPSVAAELKGNDYIVSGEKAAWVSNGTIATHALLHVGLDPSRGMEGQGLAVVPLDLQGISRGKPLDKMGQRPLNQGSIVFNDVKIPKKYMILPDPEIVTALGGIGLARVNTGMAMVFAGLAWAAFDEALAYAKQRVQGGVPIIEHKNIRINLFRMFTFVEAARANVRRMALYNADHPDAPSVAHAVAAKVFSTETAVRIASEAMQIFGGIGRQPLIATVEVFMPINEVKKVRFVGAGTMGCFNSLVTALAGYDVMLYDVSEEALEKAPGRQREWALFFEEQEFCTHQDFECAQGRIARTTDPCEAAREADLLSESVPERLELKRETHKMFEQILPAHAIMTTNTSSLLLSEIESAVKGGDRFAAMHFHQPSSLVDIVAGPRTSTRTMDIIKRFVKSQGQVWVVLKKEKGGYLHNTMFNSVLGTGMLLSALFHADYRDVDRAWMLNQGAIAGPFGMMDFVGLNVVADIFEESLRRKEIANPVVSGAIKSFLNPYLEKGSLGAKTGRGFYEYPNPEFQSAQFLAGKEENLDLSRPMVNALHSAALGLVAQGHADFEDVDRSWMLPHNSEIGPFGMIDHLGLDVVQKNLEERAVQVEALLGNTGRVIEETKAAVSLMDTLIKQGKMGVRTGKGFYFYPDPAFKRPDFLGVVRHLQKRPTLPGFLPNLR